MYGAKVGAFIAHPSLKTGEERNALVLRAALRSSALKPLISRSIANRASMR